MFGIRKELEATDDLTLVLKLGRLKRDAIEIWILTIAASPQWPTHGFSIKTLPHGAASTND